MFACDTSQAEEEWFLFMEEDKNKKGDFSYFTADGKQRSGGFRAGIIVRLTWTISASGGIAPIFCQILHLTERELPVATCPSGILIVEVPGLVIGAAADNRIKKLGYLCFVRQGIDECHIFREYINRVYIPYISRVQHQLKYINLRDDDLFAVSYMNGALAQ